MASFTLIAHWFACVFYAIAYVERPYLPEPKYGWLDVLGRTIGQPFLPNKSGTISRSRYRPMIRAVFYIFQNAQISNV